MTKAAWTGRALLAVALLFAADAGAWYYHVSRQTAEAQARLERGAKAAAAARKASPQEIAAAQDTVRRLSLPWLDLLAALESAASEEVALLGIEPDAARGTVVISGEARDYLAALDYLRSLGRNDALADVRFVRHEHKGRAVAFSISAGWLGGSARARQ